MLVDVRICRPASVAAPSSPNGFRLVNAALERHGVKCAGDLFGLPGEVVCGHPDRHVRRVVLGGKYYFLKLEHVVGLPVRLANWRAGAGFVGRCRRESDVLAALDRAGLPGPRVAAYAEVGDRAAMLVEAADGCELNGLTTDKRLSAAGRRDAATRLGFALAELHAAGFNTPDLAAKHVFVHPETFRVTLIDWQNCRPGRAVSYRQRVRALANLTATTTGASRSDRLRVLTAYLTASGPGLPPVAWWVRRLMATRVRHHAAPPKDQVLTWVRGEEVIARGSGDGWNSKSPWYPARGEPFTVGKPIPVALPEGGVGCVTRFRELPKPRFLERLTGKPWLSSAANLARVLFRLETVNAPSPRLAGFGQRRDGWSFIATTLAPEAEPFPYATASADMLDQLGRAVAAAHAASVRVLGTGAVRCEGGRVTLDPCGGMRYEKRLSAARKDEDLRRLLALLPSPAAGLGALAGYFSGDAAGFRAAARRLARKAAR